MVHYLKLIAIIGLCVLLLNACSEASPVPTKNIETQSTAVLTRDDPEPPPPTPSPSPTATKEPKSTLEAGEEDIRGKSVQLWHPWSGEQARHLEQLVDTFNSSNEWGIKVEATGMGDLDILWSKVSETRASNESPDIAVGYLHQILAEDAVEPIIDLEPFVQDPIWGLSLEEQADFYPVFWEADRIDDRRLAIPALRSAQLIFYNNEWAKELGFDSPPTTPEELAEQACSATQANLEDANTENDGTGGTIISTQYSSTLGWLQAFGAPVVNEDYSSYVFDDPATESAMQFLRQLYEDGCAWLPESEFNEVEFAAREGLFRTETLTAIPLQTLAFTRLSNQDEWSVLAFPSPQGKPAMPVYGPSYTLLSSKPDQQLAAWIFLRWLIQPENEAQWVLANTSFPIRETTLEQIRQTGEMPAQWAEAVDSLFSATSEPAFASWSQVRWALHDATTQLYRSYFTMDGIPEMIDFLQKTADDLHQEFDP